VAKYISLCQQKSVRTGTLWIGFLASPNTFRALSWYTYIESIKDLAQRLWPRKYQKWQKSAIIGNIMFKQRGHAGTLWVGFW